MPQLNSVVPVALIVGGVTSDVHVTVRDADEVLPQASIAVQVLVCEREHPLLVIFPSVDVTVGVAHASVTVADPNAALICAVLGLQDMLVPVTEIAGAVISCIQVTVEDTVAVFPHASVAVNVLVCILVQPLD